MFPLSPALCPFHFFKSWSSVSTPIYCKNLILSIFFREHSSQSLLVGVLNSDLYHFGLVQIPGWVSRWKVTPCCCTLSPFSVCWWLLKTGSGRWDGEFCLAFLSLRETRSESVFGCCRCFFFCPFSQFNDLSLSLQITDLIQSRPRA